MPDTASAPLLDGLVIELRNIDALIPYARNARTHSPEQVAQIAASIQEFGWTNPILADGEGVVAGHGRLLAARQLLDAGHPIKTPAGREIPRGYVPVLDCTGWSEAKRRAYVLADNQIALNSGWDAEMLKLELTELSALNFDLSLTGFSLESVDAYMKGLPPLDDAEEEGLSENYSRKIEAPIYRPTGERPAVADLIDESKTIALQDEIEATEGLPDDVRDFLLAAAERHTVFNFRRIAEFYAHADAPTQRLMEKSALVIIDFNQAIEGGFVRLSEGMMEQAEASKARNHEAEDAE